MSNKDGLDKLNELEWQQPSVSTPSHVSTRRKWLKLACLALLVPTVFHLSSYHRCRSSRSWDGQRKTHESAWAFDLLHTTAGDKGALSSAELEKLFL